MTKRKTATRKTTTRLSAIRHPYAGLLPGLPHAELDAIRRFIQERAWETAAAGPYEPSFDEQSEAAQAAWEADLRERVKKIQACAQRGYHVTTRSEGKPLANDRSLVSMACVCGAYRRVIIHINAKPPMEWT